MSEMITKLRPDRDLQCYFQTPSAVAALSAASPTGFTVSGCWRQQFDWAVVEWNRDNVFEHPQLRNLPDGDLSGVVLTYQEQRTNCIQPDSTLYPTVEWPSLRIWADPGSGEQVYYVPLRTYGAPVVGSVQQASATFTLSGGLTEGDLIELAWDEEHINYVIAAGDTVESAANSLAYAITQYSTLVTATVNGASIILTIRSDNPDAKAYAGANGNRLGAYGTVSGAGTTESWSPVSQQFSGGESPSKWEFTLNFSQLAKDLSIPTNNIRKMRWTYAADLQPGTYQHSEFSVVVTNWSVTGTNLTYSVAGPGSRRVEDDSAALTYSSGWNPSAGNFSGGTIQYTTQPLTTCTYQFLAEQAFQIYIGTRMAADCARITVTVDGVSLPTVDLALALEDTLIRLPAGTVQPGGHTLVIQHSGNLGTYLYFDFIDLVVPSQVLPTFALSPVTTLATDWDTEHSIALAPERTAWLIDKLGFTGRANHYAGALWFYELVRVGHVYATGTIQFSGQAKANCVTTIAIGLAGSGQDPNKIDHVHLAGDTLDSIALAFALRINSGYTSVWATATGPTLTIQSRLMGSDGNAITIAVSTTQLQDMTVTASSPQLTGGANGEGGGVGDILSANSPKDTSLASYAAANEGWRIDLTALPRVNRACRDWSRSFFLALKGYGIEATAAFSMELQHGDPALSTGIAQRYPSGNAVVLTTPALQTNFSPVSLAFWQQVYADMAQVMVDAGQTPYLQFGEVQWWYFPYDGSGLPFYDQYTMAQFSAQYGGQTMGTITDNQVQPTKYPQEAEFLPTLIGAFTRGIQQFVRQSHPTARFEVLYPVDTNSFPFTGVVNLPLADWTPSTLSCLKTENFTFTGEFNLEMASGAVTFPMELGFSAAQASHLVGISNPQAPWQKEAAVGTGTGLESVVLFALDQYCLIGYQAQSWNAGARSFMIP
jgi:hypothetical protein